MSKAPNDKSPNSPASAQDDEPMSEARASAIERALEEGWELLETGEDEAAMQKAEALVAKEPEVAEAIFLLASCQQSAGDTDAAVATLARAIELEPEWAEPELAVDGANNVHAAWRRKLSSTKVSFDVVVRRFAGGVWEPEVVLGHKDTLRTYHPRLVVADDGRAASAFYFFAGFTDPDTTESEGYRAFVGLYR